MAGPLTIQRYPTALLPLLGMQTSGDTPTLLHSEVSADIDVLDFYTRDRWTGWLSNANLTNVAGVVNVSAPTPIPQGQQWLVYGVSGQVTQAAATTGRYQLMLSLSQSGNAVYIPVGPVTSLAASESAYFGGFLDRPLLLRPSDAVLIQVQAYTGAANSSLFGMLLYAPLSV